MREEDGYLPGVDELRALVDDRTRVIVLNNPSNPTGALMDEALLREIVAVARERGAWIHRDEVYRKLEHEPGTTSPSIADLYEKGVSSGSMSKSCSLAGLRTGWVAGSPELIESSLETVRGNLAIVDEWLGREPRLHSVRQRAGTTALVRYDYQVPSAELCQAMFDFNGAFVVPGIAFGEEHSLRLGYACACDVLVGGLAAISEYLRTLEA